MKETILTTLARIDERLSNFIITNTTDHAELMKRLQDLSVHVNHQNDITCGRLNVLETWVKKEKTEAAYRLKICKAIIAILSIVGSVVTALRLLGVI